MNISRSVFLKRMRSLRYASKENDIFPILLVTFKNSDYAVLIYMPILL